VVDMDGGSASLKSLPSSPALLYNDPSNDEKENGINIFIRSVTFTSLSFTAATSLPSNTYNGGAIRLYFES
jgi:hypothetical protein